MKTEENPPLWATVLYEIGKWLFYIPACVFAGFVIAFLIAFFLWDWRLGAGITLGGGLIVLLIHYGVEFAIYVQKKAGKA